jgi:hypothetical protein
LSNLLRQDEGFQDDLLYKIVDKEGWDFLKERLTIQEIHGILDLSSGHFIQLKNFLDINIELILSEILHFLIKETSIALSDPLCLLGGNLNKYEEV